MYSKFKIQNSCNGFVFLEILISVTLVSLVFLVLLAIGVQSITLSGSLKKAAQIDALIKEQIEAVRSFRDGSTWATTGLGGLSTGAANPYYATLDASVNPPTWLLQSGTQVAGEFSKKIVIDKVSRNPSTQAIEGGYNPYHDDADTRKITVTITYASRDYQVVAYFTNWQGN